MRPRRADTGSRRPDAANQLPSRRRAALHTPRSPPERGGRGTLLLTIAACYQGGLRDASASYRRSKEKGHSHDAALLSHGVSGVDLHRASAADDLVRRRKRDGAV